MQNLRYRYRRKIDDVIVTSLIELATKFGTGVVFWEVQTCAKFHYPNLTVTLFSGGGWNPPPVIESQKKARLNRVKFQNESLPKDNGQGLLIVNNSV